MEPLDLALEGERIDHNTPTERVIAWSLERFRGRSVVLTTAFGLEGCALIAMYAAHADPPTAVYADTGFLFPETLAVRDRLIERYPNLSVVRCAPALTPEAQAEQYGPALWSREPDRCCALRKVEPLREVLQAADVWITAITRGQTEARAGTPVVGWDARYGVIKLCPLATWDRPRVWEYVRRHDVPHNALHQRGYPTVGCTHCTRPVPGAAADEYRREGRWSGRSKTECGLHFTAPGAEPDSPNRRASA